MNLLKCIPKDQSTGKNIQEPPVTKLIVIDPSYNPKHVTSFCDVDTPAEVIELVIESKSKELLQYNFYRPLLLQYINLLVN